MMSPEEIMSQASSPGPTRTSRKKMLIYGGIVAILLIVIISVSVVVAKNNQENAQIAALRNMIAEALAKENIDATDLRNGNTPQGKAFNWLYFSNPNVNSMERTLVLQRYALAAFYYSTYQVVNLYTPNPPIWARSYNWLTTADVCEWEGVQCTNRKRVNGISLESNSLTGKIPGDLVLLREHLVNLDLTTNFLYMEPADYKFFSSLTLLQTLLLDDNYLLTDGGLPSELGACTDLVWIRMSYNLLVGELSNDLFKNLTKLTHLEVESNFLTGTMPSAVGHLEELIYLYMRRNSMVYNLDFIKTNKMKNLFAMWLDANKLEGTIPTQIGQLTGLASLSLTNGTLTGTIPTQFGHLSGLRRVWLYGNELQGTIPTQIDKLIELEVFEVQRNLLNGTMPSALCQIVAEKTYEHKSLVADCSEVTCATPACCTTCS